jgi:hypothetical protein
MSAVTLNEPQCPELLDRLNALLATTALSREALRNLHGVALNALVRQMIANDNNYLFGGSRVEQKNYRRRVSRVAYQVLLSVEVQKQREAITALEINERIKALTASRLTDSVFEQTKALMTTLQQDSDDDQDLPANELGIFDEVPFPEEPEEDLEGLAAMEEGPLIRLTDEEGAEAADDDKAIPYVTAVKIFMEIILTNSMNEYSDAKNNPVKCSLCLEDDSVNQSMKVRIVDATK